MENLKLRFDFSIDWLTDCSEDKCLWTLNCVAIENPIWIRTNKQIWLKYHRVFIDLVILNETNDCTKATQQRAWPLCVTHTQANTQTHTRKYSNKVIKYAWTVWKRECLAYLADIYRKMRCCSKRPEAITVRLFGRTVSA